MEGRHLHSNGSTSLGSFSREMQYQSTEADRARDRAAQQQHRDPREPAARPQPYVQPFSVHLQSGPVTVSGIDTSVYNQQTFTNDRPAYTPPPPPERPPKFPHVPVYPPDWRWESRELDGQVFLGPVIPSEQHHTHEWAYPPQERDGQPFNQRGSNASTLGWRDCPVKRKPVDAPTRSEGRHSFARVINTKRTNRPGTIQKSPRPEVDPDAVRRWLERQQPMRGARSVIRNITSKHYASRPRPTTTVSGHPNRLGVYEPPPTQQRVRHKSRTERDHAGARSTATTAADRPRAVRPPRPEACQNSASMQRAVQPAGRSCSTGSPRTETNQDQTLVAVAPVAHTALAVPVEPSSPEQDPELQDSLSRAAAKAADEKRKAAKAASCRRHRATVADLRKELASVRSMAEITRDLLIPLVGADKWSEIQRQAGQARVVAASKQPMKRPYIAPESSSDEESENSDCPPKRKTRTVAQGVLTNMTVEDYLWAPLTVIKWIVKSMTAIFWSLLTRAREPRETTEQDTQTSPKGDAHLCQCADCECTYQVGQFAPLCDECFAHHDAGDVCICDCCTQPGQSPKWATSRKARNKLAHATNGNTTIVKRVYLEGAPILAKGETDLKRFLLWSIDLRAFCETMGLTQWVIGPAPAAPTEAAALATHREKLAEGLRYLCAMVADSNLKAGIALNAGGSGVEGYQYLAEEFLQGRSVQSQYLQMLREMRLQMNDSVVVFRNQWQKTVSQLRPPPDASILCEMFAQSVTMDTGTFYDACIDQDLSRADVGIYTRKVTQLCQKRKDRADQKVRSGESDNVAGGTALQATVERAVHRAMRNAGPPRKKEPAGNNTQRDGANSRRNGDRQGSSQRTKQCVRCGSVNHSRSECRAPKAKCQFTYPDGTKCGGDHLEKFCWAKHPELCKLPKIKASIQKRLGHTERSAHHSRTKSWASDDEDEDDEEACGLACEVVQTPCETYELHPFDTYMRLNEEYVQEEACKCPRLPPGETCRSIHPVEENGVCSLCNETANLPDGTTTCECPGDCCNPLGECEAAKTSTEDAVPYPSADAIPANGTTSLTESKTSTEDAVPYPSADAIPANVTTTLTESANTCETVYPSDDDEAVCQASITAPKISPLSDRTEAVIEIAGHLTEIKNQLVVDTGASDHIIFDERCIQQLDMHTSTRIRIKTGNKVSAVTSIGPATFAVQDNHGNTVYLTRRVLYIKGGFTANLWSVPKDFDAHGTRTEFEPNNCITLSDGTVIPFHRGTIRQYVLDYQPPGYGIIAERSTNAHHGDSEAAIAQLSTEAEALSLWHRRMGHCSATVLHHLPKHVLHVPEQLCTAAEASAHNKACLICPMAKLKAASHPDNRKEPGAKKGNAPQRWRDQLCDKFGERIFMDLAGPLPPSIQKGFRYVSSFVDDGTDMIWVYFCVHKSEQKTLHNRFRADTRRYGDVKEYHSDNGGEYKDKEYLADILQEGAARTFTVPYTPNQNNKAENAFWRIFCIARALLFESGMPSGHWPYAIQHAVYILQRTPVRRIAEGAPVWSTPYYNAHGRKPSSRHLRVWGCRVLVETTAMQRKQQDSAKLAPRAEVAYYMGRSRDRRAYVLFIPEPGCTDFTRGKYVERRTVIFHENTVPRTMTMSARKQIASTGKEQNPPDNDDSEDGEAATEVATPPVPPTARPTRLCATPGCTLPDGHDLGHSFERGGGGGGGLPSGNLRPRTAMITGVDDSPPPQGMPTKQFKLASGAKLIWAKSASHFDLSDAMFATNVLDQEEVVEALATQDKGYLNALVARQKTFRNEGDDSFHTRSVPKNIRDALKSADKKEWIKAMEDELSSHLQNGTWILVPKKTIPGKRRQVGSTWAYDLKRAEDGTIKRYKARLCAQGFSQEEGVDYFETYSNTIRYETLRMILAIAALYSLHLSSIDIKTAYLNGYIEEGLDIFMTPPRGFTLRTDRNNPAGVATFSDSYAPDDKYVCLLKRSIYGLKQSGRRWETCLWNRLRELGGAQCEVDPCMWVIKREGRILLIAIYVDDVVFATNSPTFRDGIVSQLKESYNVVDQGELTWIFGTAIKQNLDAGTVQINQGMYIEDLVRQYTPDQVKGRAVPCSPDIYDLQNLPEGEMLHPQYRTIIGQLMWVSIISRPDIAFAVSYLARFNAKGTQLHFDWALRVVSYLKVTMDKTITYRRETDGQLTEHLLAHSELKEFVFGKNSVIFFSDSSHGGERPMAGYIGFLADAPFAWSAFRLTLTPLSVCQGEYHAATKAAVAAKAYADIMQWAGYPSQMATPIFCDNKAAVLLSDSGISSKKLRHVATHIAFLRELINSGNIMLLHISTKGQIADIFTKPLHAATFHELRVRLVN